MSLTATIIAFASGLAAKVKTPRQEEIFLSRENARLLEVIDRAHRQIETLDLELATERSLKLHWRDEAQRLATDAHERLYAAMAQQQGGQQGFQQLGAVAQNLLGAQNLDQARWREWVCTCIPDRASALRRS
jgi:hypothetical protein